MFFRSRGLVLFSIVGIVLWAVSELDEIRMLTRVIQTSPSTVLEKTTETTQNGEVEGVQRPIQTSPSIVLEKTTQTTQNGEVEGVQRPIQTSPSVVPETTTHTTQKGTEEGVQRPIQTSPSVVPETTTHTTQKGTEKGVQLPITVKSNASDVDAAFRFCTKLRFPLADKGFKMQYWCNGTHYNEFGSALKSLAATLPKPMGRRPFPVSANKQVLCMGNSHTGQMMSGLLCQYSNEVIEYKKVPGVMNGIMVRFRNNSTITSLTNSPVVYSPQWQTLLQKGGIRLQSLDGVVLGKFNLYADLLGKAYADKMDQRLKTLPGDVRFSTATAPSLSDVASVFDGPIVYVGMFAKYAQSEQTVNLNFTQSVRSTRDNLSVIDGRKYINEMKMECGAGATDGVGWCVETKGDAENRHRCIGDKGGHPDLIAWEVVEKLNAL